MSTSIACCKSQPKGPGYGSAVEAMKNGPSESILLVTCVRPDKSGPDYLATVDVDPNSPSYATVIERTEMSYVGDEVHHSVCIFILFLQFQTGVSVFVSVL